MKGSKTKGKNGHEHKTNMAANLESMVTNKPGAGKLRKSTKTRHKPKWLRDLIH